ncbi:MAG: hypothetical protein AAFR13_02615, partial [Pseudomonadota bacterium]
MMRRVIHADQQLCFRALCGMGRERVAADAQNRPVRIQIVGLAMQGMRRLSRRNGRCTHCPYA